MAAVGDLEQSGDTATWSRAYSAPVISYYRGGHVNTILPGVFLKPGFNVGFYPFKHCPVCIWVLRVKTCGQHFEVFKEVNQPPLPVLYLREQGIALVDADLTPETRAVAADWLLEAVSSEP